MRCVLDGDERAQDAELVVTELATNAVRHARSPFTVTVTLGAKLRVEVGDESTELPAPRVAPPDAVDGRGLEIVEALAFAWGTRLYPAGGKAVWAGLDGLSTTLDAPAMDERAFRGTPDASFAPLNVAELLGKLLERVTKLVDADTAAVLLLDEEDRLLRATAALGVEDEVREGVSVPIGVVFAGRIAAECRSIALDRVDSTTVVSKILWEAGIRSMLGVPLQARGRLLGVLHAGRLSGRRFNEDDVELLELIGRRVAIDLTLLEHFLRPSLPTLRRLVQAARC